MLYSYLIGFGIVVIAAGVQGFLKGSVISLVAAGILGACLLAGAFLLGSSTTVALVLGLVGSLGVAGKFLPAFLKAPDKVAALWPAGVLAIGGVIGIVLVAQAFLRR